MHLKMIRHFSQHLASLAFPKLLPMNLSGYHEESIGYRSFKTVTLVGRWGDTPLEKIPL